ncbi:MAG: tetratricopeptide repeat protein [Rhizobiales bacterium]|nr:tetratricopeptide repeat protein [Hyphomicrobiales bacterium]
MPFDQDTSPLQCIVAFTGRFAAMKREDAFALVRKYGGTPRRGVTKKTCILVVGELGWPLLPNGEPSKSLGLAKSYGVRIASERQFLEWTGRAVPNDQVKTYAASQISSLSGLPLDAIEQLTAFGLLDCRHDRYGFRDLAAARQIAELFGSGVALSTITRGLYEIRKWLPDAALSNLKLYPSSADTLLIEHMKGRTDKKGQFMLPVGGAQESPDEVFEQAQSAEQARDVETAVRLYRKVMRIDPGDPAAAFNLGNLLRSIGRKVEAEAAYRGATRADPRFAEAWYNLADILDDQGQPNKAIGYLKRAVEADPNYADAIFNLGLLHQRCDRHADAAGYWRRYLALDNQSAWAARARRALKFCEMNIARS